MGMKMKEIYEKICISMTGLIIGEKFGLLFPAISLLTILMILDYFSGMLAAKKEAVEHPNDSRYGWSSKKSIIGIYKKLGYIMTIIVSVSIDYVLQLYGEKLGIEIQMKTVFGLLVTIWLIINELISILENAGRMGVELPQLLKRTLAELKKDIEEQ
ncbi:MAG: phage holin family protein [Lachnospiraceae bacterium]|nr:phage holin family protein [Lachnospiraceae bacterium]